MINQAEAYKEERIKGAQGDVISFKALLSEYKKGKEITKTRLYLEMIEQVYPGMEKYIVDEKSGALKLITVDGLEKAIKETTSDEKAK